MKNIFLLFVFGLAGSTVLFGQNLSAIEILEKTEANQLYDNFTASASMVINDFYGERESEFTIYQKGKDLSLVEFTSSLEYGQKVLRVKNKLYLFYPDADEIITLSQSMLQQSFMDSDISFQDIAGDRSLVELYTVTLEKEEEREGTECYVLFLSGKKPLTLTYPYQRVWIDKETFTLVFAELFTLRKKLVKTLAVHDYKKLGRQYVYTHIEFNDVIKENSRTEIFLEKLRKTQISDKKFTLESLRF